MSNTTLAARIARTTAALVVAGALIGGGGVALAHTGGDAPAPAALSMSLPASGEYQGDDDATTGGDDQDASSSAASTTAGTPPPAGTTLTATGAVNGTVTADEVSCTPLGAGSFTWELKGTIDAAPVTITYITSVYHGADTYGTTGITDEHGGLLDVETDTVSAVTNGFSPGAFVVDEGERTGTLDAELSSDGLPVHVSGSWACSPA